MLAFTIAIPNTAAEASDDDISIICANSLLADLTENVVGDLATVEYIMPAGACPSHFDSRPSDINLVASADVIVQIGWEGWLNDLMDSSGNGDTDRIKTVGLGDWNLESNAASYKAQIDTKANELTLRVQSEGVEGHKVVVMEWQKVFVEWLGFEVVTAYGPPETLSLEESINTTEAASGNDVSMVIDNLQSGTEFGAQVASQTGASHVIVTNFPGAYPNANTYLDMLDYNTDKLIDGAKTYEYKKGDIAQLEDQVDELKFQNALYLSLSVIFLLVSIFIGVLFVRARGQGS
jgi:ABC-type Zn uptake system ZnuABC Zn-binding protein ZnuA